jgi:hypothetical protein
VFFFAECFLTLGKVFAECPKKALGKEPFADEIFAECSLPSVTLGKAFAECKIAFAECLRHSAKNAIPVVNKKCPIHFYSSKYLCICLLSSLSSKVLLGSKQTSLLA